LLSPLSPVLAARLQGERHTTSLVAAHVRDEHLARLGVRLEVTERLLTHVSGSMDGIVGVYQRHEFMDEMREGISRYAAWLSHVLETSL
jgi:hypothetical protein